jgi:TM2 domain-containing membrane protein YozV
MSTTNDNDDTDPTEGNPAEADNKPGADEQYCSSCGEIIKKEAEICPHCGVRQKPAPGSTTGSKDRVTAGILALLLGGIGAHKFYLGQTGLGVLYLCFSWTLIPALVGFIEGILYLTKSDEEFQQKYVED